MPEPQISRETQLELLEHKVATVSSALGDIQNSLRRVEEAAGVIRIIELQNQQQTKDIERASEQVTKVDTQLTKRLQDLEQDLEETSVKFASDMSAVKLELAETKRALEDQIKTNQSGWTEKFSYFRGIFSGVSFLLTLIFSVLGGTLWVVVQDNVNVVKETVAFVEKLKILNVEQILRESRIQHPPVP